jgi:hypothetical protein
VQGNDLGDGLDLVLGVGAQQLQVGVFTDVGQPPDLRAGPADAFGQGCLDAAPATGGVPTAI